MKRRILVGLAFVAVLLLVAWQFVVPPSSRDHAGNKTGQNAVDTNIPDSIGNGPTKHLDESAAIEAQLPAATAAPLSQRNLIKSSKGGVQTLVALRPDDTSYQSPTRPQVESPFRKIKVDASGTRTLTSEQPNSTGMQSASMPAEPAGGEIDKSGAPGTDTLVTLRPDIRR